MCSRDDRVFYVYLDWTLEEVPRCFYVGKGLIARLLYERERNTHWKAIVAKHGLHREIILATKDEAFAFEQEKRLIADRKTFYGHVDYVWGANKTEGGEGTVGYRHSDEFRRKVGRLNATRQVSLETREKMSTSNKGRKRSDETRKRMSCSRSGPGASAAKLTWDDVRAIRTSAMSLNMLARRYNVTRSTIWSIRTGVSWKENKCLV